MKKILHIEPPIFWSLCCTIAAVGFYCYLPEIPLTPLFAIPPALCTLAILLLGLRALLQRPLTRIEQLASLAISIVSAFVIVTHVLETDNYFLVLSLLRHFQAMQMHPAGPVQ